MHQIKLEDNNNNNNNYSALGASRLSEENMKKNDITTLDDLKVFLAAYQEENPEDDCCELVRNICQENGWIYTDDSSIAYDDEDFATDGVPILILCKLFLSVGISQSRSETIVPLCCAPISPPQTL